MKNITVFFLSLILLNSCNLKHKSEDLVLASWDFGAITSDDLVLKIIKDANFKRGKNALRNILAKNMFRKKYAMLAIEMSLDKTKLFKQAVLEDKRTFLAEHYKNQMIEYKVSVSDQEISDYFDSHATDFQASDVLWLYFYQVECNSIEMCKETLIDNLNKRDFESLSLAKDKPLSGFYKNIPITKLNISIQKEVEDLSIKKISEPIKISSNSYVFVLIDKIIHATKPKLSDYKKLITKKIYDRKVDDTLSYEINKLKQMFHDIESDEKLFEEIAMQQGFEEDEFIIPKLELKKEWMLSNFGFDNSNLFEMTAQELRNLINNNEVYTKALLRYNISVIELSKSQYIESTNALNNQNLNKYFTAKYNDFLTTYSEISLTEFFNIYKEFKFDISNEQVEKWIGPSQLNDKYLWFKIESKLLSNDNGILFDDYKKFLRSYITSYQTLMDLIGNDINFKFNPVIYTDGWGSIADRIIKKRLEK